MPQDDLLLPWLKVWENALVPIRMKNLPLKDAKQKVISLGHSFGLEKHLDHYPGNSPAD
jgi:ABC-type nitrate/sulfonate/bicarbonate transport system ATPase subunit